MLSGVRVEGAGTQSLNGLTQLQELDLTSSPIKDLALVHIDGAAVAEDMGGHLGPVTRHLVHRQEYAAPAHHLRVPPRLLSVVAEEELKKLSALHLRERVRFRIRVEESGMIPSAIPGRP